MEVMFFAWDIVLGTAGDVVVLAVVIILIVEPLVVVRRFPTLDQGIV
jgi:hypothetical protein